MNRYIFLIGTMVELPRMPVLRFVEKIEKDRGKTYCCNKVTNINME